MNAIKFENTNFDLCHLFEIFHVCVFVYWPGAALPTSLEVCVPLSWIPVHPRLRAPSTGVCCSNAVQCILGKGLVFTKWRPKPSRKGLEEEEKINLKIHECLFQRDAFSRVFRASFRFDLTIP